MKKKEKMKNKILASLEIAMFCLLFFVALPGIAAATEDETLDIYGNANEDDIIDMRDLTFTARMILRLEDESRLLRAWPTTYTTKRCLNWTPTSI
jgi:iron complex transport system substrate-binding protein